MALTTTPVLLLPVIPKPNPPTPLAPLDETSLFEDGGAWGDPATLATVVPFFLFKLADADAAAVVVFIVVDDEENDVDDNVSFSNSIISNCVHSVFNTIVMEEFTNFDEL